ESLNITYKELDRFKELGLAGLRLDLGFSGSEEAAMSFDDTDLKIELNISNGTRYVENILSYQANVGNIIGCHNFYPRKYTG
ncbi:MupG family TIM beta-alpha barrel fold protein, partial [Listeria monocytogenes]